jgi:hypothetical protein
VKAEEQRATIESLEEYIATLVGILQQQSAQLVSSRKFSKNVGITDDLQTAYRTEIQALNQQKKFVTTAAPAAHAVGDVERCAQVQKCIDYLYNFVLEVNLFAKRGDTAVEEALATQIQEGKHFWRAVPRD